jgi:hypothetical protein
LNAALAIAILHLISQVRLPSFAKMLSKYLKANITKEIQAVTADVLVRNFQNMARRVQSCLDANGGNFQHVL